MREIKFRAWDAKEKQMLEVNHLFNLDNKQPIEVWTNYYEGGYRFNPDKLEIMQYTGLRDKTGREIYEGDIVRSSPRRQHEKSFVGAVNYGRVDPSFTIRDKDGHDFRLYLSGEYRTYEVIGNVYANPELLEAEK